MTHTQGEVVPFCGRELGLVAALVKKSGGVIADTHVLRRRITEAAQRRVGASDGYARQGMDGKASARKGTHWRAACARRFCGVIAGVWGCGGSGTGAVQEGAHGRHGGAKGERVAPADISFIYFWHIFLAAPKAREWHHLTRVGRAHSSATLGRHRSYTSYLVATQRPNSKSCRP